MGRHSRIVAVALGLLAVVGGLLAGAAVAGSDTRSNPNRFAVDSPAVRTAQDIARAYWGVDPCGGRIEVSWKRQSREVNAISTWSTRSGDPYGDPANNGDCTIQLNPRAQFDWPKLCTVVVHEYGHLAGNDHEERPGRLMSAYYTTPLRACTTGVTRRALRSRTS